MAGNKVNKVGFFTPVVFQGKKKTLGQKVSEKMDAYLYLGVEEAKVLNAGKGRKHVVKVEGDKKAQNKALKISTYVLTLGIAPLVALIAKGISRIYYKFEVTKEEKASHVVRKSAAKVTQAVKVQKEVKKVEGEEGEEAAEAKRKEEEASEAKRLEEVVVEEEKEVEGEKKEEKEETEAKKAEAEKAAAEEARRLETAEKVLFQNQEVFKETELDLISWFVTAPSGDYAIVRKDAGKYIMHIKEGADLLLEIDETNQLKVFEPQKKFDTFGDNFDSIARSEPKVFEKLDAIVEKYKEKGSKLKELKLSQREKSIALEAEKKGKSKKGEARKKEIVSDQLESLRRASGADVEEDLVRIFEQIEEEEAKIEAERQAAEEKRLVEERKVKLEQADKQLQGIHVDKFIKEDTSFYQWYGSASNGDYAIVRKDVGKYIVHIKEGTNLLVQIDENDKFKVSFSLQTFDTFSVDFDSIEHSEPIVFANFNEILQEYTGVTTQILRSAGELKVKEAEKTGREESKVLGAAKKAVGVIESEDSDISGVPGSEEELSSSDESSLEPETVHVRDQEERLQQQQNLSTLYQAVRKYIVESKKKGLHKLLLNEQDKFVVRGTKKRSATDEEVVAFNKIISGINTALRLGVDRFLVLEEKEITEKEVSIFELMDDIFSSKLASRVIGRFIEKRKFDEESDLATLIYSNLEFIKEFSPELYGRLNIFEAKEEVKKASKKEKTEKMKRSLRSSAKKDLQKDIEQIFDFAPVPLRSKRISEEIDKLESPVISGTVESELAIKLPPPPINNPFNEMLETEKSFCEQIKWFSEERVWPGIEGKMDFFEALQKVGVITDKERILFAKGWKDLQTSSQEIIKAYPDFSKGTHADNMEKLIALLSSQKFQVNLKNAANLIAKYTEMNNRLKELGRGKKTKEKDILQYLFDNNKMMDYLTVSITPIQRICRYPLFFKEMLKLIPEGNARNQFLEIDKYLKGVLDIVNPLMPKA